MPAIPNFVLKRLYVKGSLVNTPDGCEIQLRNFVGSGTLTGLLSVDVDGKTFPTDALSVALPDGGIRSGESVIPTAPLVLASGVAVAIRLHGARLEAGNHALKVRILTGEMGRLDIALSDAVREKPAAAQADTPRAAAAQAASPAGAISRPLKVAIIGAGSAVFARQLMADISLSRVSLRALLRWSTSTRNVLTWRNALVRRWRASQGETGGWRRPATGGRRSPDVTTSSIPSKWQGCGTSGMTTTSR